MYDNNWDKYYYQTYRILEKKALWDVPPAKAVMEDFSVFNPYFDQELPIVDLGCGTGSQSEFFSQKYSSVLGLDVSKEAISVAKENVIGDNLEFDVVDITKPIEKIDAFEKFLPANVYMRGVLHQVQDHDIKVFQKNLSSMLGEKGTLFAVEVADSIRDFFNTGQDQFSKLPARLRQVFITNLPPRGLSLDNISKYFPEEQFTLIKAGEAKLNTNIKYSDGSAIYVPAVFVLIKNK